MKAGHQHIVSELRARLGPAGFDLLEPLQVGWYNDRVEGTLRLEDFGSGAHLAVVIGNTKALWAKLLEALSRDAELASAAHPIHQYTERMVTRAVAALGIEASLRWSHDVGERRVAMQPLAHVAGLAYLSDSHLSVHAIYGSWIGLRAAVSFAVPGPASPAPELPHPCGGCSGQCLPAFERALKAMHGRLDEAAARANWQKWLACRDACPTGRQHRYSEPQIRYHYLEDRQQLRRPPLGEEEQV